MDMEVKMEEDLDLEGKRLNASHSHVDSSSESPLSKLKCDIQSLPDSSPSHSHSHSPEPAPIPAQTPAPPTIPSSLIVKIPKLPCNFESNSKAKISPCQENKKFDSGSRFEKSSGTSESHSLRKSIFCSDSVNVGNECSKDDDYYALLDELSSSSSSESFDDLSSDSDNISEDDLDESISSFEDLDDDDYSEKVVISRRKRLRKSKVIVPKKTRSASVYDEQDSIDSFDDIQLSDAYNRRSKRTSCKSYKELDESDFEEFGTENLYCNKKDEITWEGDIIEKVLDHRPINRTSDSSSGSSTGKTKPYSIDALRKWRDNSEFLIKWQGWSHFHNSWHSYEHCSQFLEFERVQRYAKHVEDEYEWMLSLPSEEREQLAIERELKLREQQDWAVVERVVASRKVKITEDNPAGILYLVKWKSLQYSECTWESPEDLKDFEKEVDDLLRRTQQYTFNPRQKPRVMMLISDQPQYMKGGTLRDYQIEGINWLLYSWVKKTNGILADEMGLGKTIQVICFLNILFKEFNVSGPFLIVVPLSTVTNWQDEFRKWAPDMNVVTFSGNSQSRKVILAHEFYTNRYRKNKFSALLTTYEMIIREKSTLGSVKWEHIMVDEAHRLKNPSSQLHESLREFKTSNKLLITGTPLQNTLKELWSLLYFLHPERFPIFESFEQEFSNLGDHENISRLHRELQPYLLRRLKKDVEKSLPAKQERILRVDPTSCQKKYYQWIIHRNLQEINKGVKGQGRSSLLNIVVDLRKVCNHPFLFARAREYEFATKDPLRAIVYASGKVVLLDKLLRRLKETGHRVLLFSQMVRMLDILAEYLNLAGWKFQRLDGSMSSDKRQKAMDSFNSDDSEDFCFLLSTRAGGLGINLATADTVIIFDSDWNPQNDLQAQSRCHRIGQEKAVNIYRLVTSGTVEENILERAKKKLVLDHLVIQSMDTKSLSNVIRQEKGPSEVFSTEELDAVLKFGAEAIFKSGDDDSEFEELDIDRILARAEESVSNEIVDTSVADELFNAFKVAKFSSVEEPEPTKERGVSFFKNLLTDEMEKKLKDFDEKIDEMEIDSDEDPIRLSKLSSKKAKKKTFLKNLKARRALVFGKEYTKFTEKEIRRFIIGLKRFGQMSRLKDAAEESGLQSRSLSELRELANSIHEACISVFGTNDQIINFAGVKINADDFINRFKIMNKVNDLVKPYLNKPQSFRFSIPIRPPSWNLLWGHREDSMLLIGTFLYGLHSFDKILVDKRFGLQKFESSSSSQLKGRVKTLFKVILSKYCDNPAIPGNSRNSNTNKSSRSNRIHRDNDVAGIKTETPKKIRQTRSEIRKRKRKSDNESVLYSVTGRPARRATAISYKSSVGDNMTNENSSKKSKNASSSSSEGKAFLTDKGIRKPKKSFPSSSSLSDDAMLPFVNRRKNSHDDKHNDRRENEVALFHREDRNTSEILYSNTGRPLRGSASKISSSVKNHVDSGIPNNSTPATSKVNKVNNSLVENARKKQVPGKVGVNNDVKSPNARKNNSNRMENLKFQSRGTNGQKLPVVKRDSNNRNRFNEAADKNGKLTKPNPETMK